MKVISEPSSGACGDYVAYVSPYGQVRRARVVPRNTQSPARDFMHSVFGHHSQTFSHKLTDEQHDRWAFAASQVMSDPRFGYGPLTAQQFYQSIQCVLSRVGAPEAAEPPPKVIFGPNPTGQLVIENTEAGVRLLLPVTGDLDTDIMVFGQAPCSPGRHKRRNVSYLGLLPPPIGGMSDITYLYRARFGEPRPGTKVFIVTCQTRNGWKGYDRVTSARVPDRPKVSQALFEPSPSSPVNVHKGSTRAAQGKGASPASHPQAPSQPGTGGGKAKTERSGGGIEPVGGGGGSAQGPNRGLNLPKQRLLTVLAQPVCLGSDRLGTGAEAIPPSRNRSPCQRLNLEKTQRGEASQSKR